MKRLFAGTVKAPIWVAKAFLWLITRAISVFMAACYDLFYGRGYVPFDLPGLKETLVWDIDERELFGLK